MSITEFLLARIAEDEEDAREAMTNHANHYEPDGGMTGRWRVAHGSETAPGSEARWLEDAATSAYSRSGTVVIYDEETPALPHIARWDPARVLTECEAKRRIIHISEGVADRRPPKGDGYEEARARRTLKLLALPYADHPDFQKDWAL